MGAAQLVATLKALAALYELVDVVGAARRHRRPERTRCSGRSTAWTTFVLPLGADRGVIAMSDQETPWSEGAEWRPP